MLLLMKEKANHSVYPTYIIITKAILRQTTEVTHIQTNILIRPRIVGILIRGLATANLYLKVDSCNSATASNAVIRKATARYMNLIPLTAGATEGTS